MMWKISDNSGREYIAKEENNIFTINKEEIPTDIEYLDFTSEDFSAKSGEKGYYVIADYDKKGSRLCFFNNKPDCERIFKQDLMPIFGVKKQIKLY